MNGTYYVITGDLGTSDYLTVPELIAMQANGSEIGSHTVDHPDLQSLSDSQINSECSDSQQFLQSRGLSAVNFAYPYGLSNSHVDSIVLQYYRSARYAYGSGYLVPIAPTAIQMSIPMGFAGEAASVSTALAQDEQVVNQAYSTNSWVIIFFHDVVPVADVASYLPYGIDTSDFTALLSYIANSGVQVLTVNQALNLWSSPQKVTALPTSPSDSSYPYSSLTMDVDQDQTFAAMASGGTSPYIYQWYLNGETVGTSSSYKFDPESTGSFQLYANAIDSSSVPINVNSNIESITVNSQLNAPTVSRSKSTLDQGQTSSISSSSVTTGTSPYSYQWYEMAPGAGSYSEISGATSKSYSFATSGSTTVGTWSFELQISDSATTPDAVTSSPVSILVNAAPTVSVSPGSWIMDVGQSKAFTASPVGGSGSYSSSGYQWFVGGVAQSGQTSSSFSYSAGSVGSPLITVTVTDNLGVISAQSAAPSVTVNVSPTVSILPVGSLTLDVGQVQVFTATPSGGSGSLSYQWYEDITKVGNGSASYSYIAAGSSHVFYCNVTDGASKQVISSSNAVSVTVNSALAPSTVAHSLGTVDQGQTSSLTSSSITTGTSPYTYQWLEWAPNGSKASVGSNSASFNFVTSTSTATGIWSFILQITDNAGVTVGSSAVSISVNSALVDPTVSASAATVNLGQTSSLTSFAVTTGNSPYTYQWFQTGPNGSYVAAASNSASFNFVTSTSTATGIWSFILQVTDNAGVSVNSSAVSVTVNPTISVSAGAGGSISPTGNINVSYGDSQSFTITANTGYYVVDVLVNGGSVGAVKSYTIPHVESAYTISATFALSPTASPSPTETPTSKSSPTPISTHAPTATPTQTPKITASPTQTSKTSKNPTTNQNLHIETIYGVAAIVVILVILAIAFVSIKRRTPKFGKHQTI